jgi:heme a synthase
MPAAVCHRENEVPDSHDAPRGLHSFAVLTSASTLFLIFAGGLVTTTGSGLAVPDWPLSYGSLFPPMVGGIFYEHGHRMVAATVGFLTVILTIWIFLKERRRWVGRIAAAGLAAVILQGALGGLTVLLLLPPAVSILHACLAQTFFCLTVVLASVTSRGWSAAAAPRGGRSALPGLAMAVTGGVFVQLVLGAVMRHLHAGLAIPDFPLSFGRLVPSFESLPIAVNFAHRAWGITVGLLALGLAARVIARPREEAWPRRAAIVIAALVPLQITLGAFTVWSARGMFFTTLHVATGAALLAACLTLALRLQRLAWLSGRAEGRFAAVSAPAPLSGQESPA